MNCFISNSFECKEFLTLKFALVPRRQHVLAQNITQVTINRAKKNAPPVAKAISVIRFLSIPLVGVVIVTSGGCVGKGIVVTSKALYIFPLNEILNEFLFISNLSALVIFVILAFLMVKTTFTEPHVTLWHSMSDLFVSSKTENCWMKLVLKGAILLMISLQSPRNLTRYVISFLSSGAVILDRVCNMVAMCFVDVG